MFLFPLTGFLFEEYRSPIGLINYDMFWLFILSFYMVYGIFSNKRLSFSRTFVLLLVYYGYLIINAIVNNYSAKILKTDIFIFITSSLTILLIDNLSFSKSSLSLLRRNIFILITLTLAGSFSQIFIDSSLFVPADRYEQLSRIDFAGYWRNSSIFDSLMENQGGIMFIFMMFLFWQSSSSEEIKKQSLAIFFLILIGVMTFTRYVFLSQIMILVYFNFFAKRFTLKRTIAIGLCSIILMILFLTNENTILSSDFIQTRLLADVSGRTNDPFYFFQRYLSEHNILFGTGASSFDIEYFYSDIQRLHSGIWDLFFQGGIIGLILYLSVIYQFYRKCRFVFRKTGDSTFLLGPMIIILINFTARLNYFYFLGLILFYLVITINVKLIQNKVDMRINNIDI
jgi:hypothetical protein